MTLHEAITARRSCRSFSSQSVSFGMVERLLWAGQGVTDDAGNRTAPSAHALQPMHMCVVARRIHGIEGGIYNVAPGDLELDIITAADVRFQLEQAAYDDQPWIAEAAAIICLCADMLAPANEFASQSPYGMRGYRYAYIEAGAAAQNMALQAAEEDLGAVLVAGFRDEAVASILRLEPHIAPIALLCIGRPA